MKTGHLSLVVSILEKNLEWRKKWWRWGERTEMVGPKKSKTCTWRETQTRENVEEKASYEKVIVESGKGFLSVENK